VVAHAHYLGCFGYLGFSLYLGMGFRLSLDVFSDHLLFMVLSRGFRLYMQGLCPCGVVGGCRAKRHVAPI